MKKNEKKMKKMKKMKKTKKILLSGLTFISISFAANAQVGINTETPNSNSTLDIVSTNKGVLIPRVDLTSSTLDLNGDTDNSVANQPVGLLVYNIGTSLSTGFYYWDGSEWRNVDNSTSEAPTITSIDCSNATLNPPLFSASVPFTGYMRVPYDGGNGASYSTMPSIISVGNTGLTAVLQPGKLGFGYGELIYKVTGTPNSSSPTGASFSIPSIFGTSGCTTTVGLGNAFAVGETRSCRVVVPATDFFTNGGTRQVMNGNNATNITTTDRKSAWEISSDIDKARFITIVGLRLDFIESSGNGNVAPKFFNTLSTPVTYSLSALSTNDRNTNMANSTCASNTFSYFIDGNDDFALNGEVGGINEYVNAMLSLSDGSWYQLTYYATRDTSNVSLFMTATRLN